MTNDQAVSTEGIRLAVLGIYREVLGSTAFTAQDDFFDHGGDSVKGVDVVHGIRDLLGVKLSVSTLFMLRTVDEITEEITTVLVDPADHDAPRG